MMQEAVTIDSIYILFGKKMTPNHYSVFWQNKFKNSRFHSQMLRQLSNRWDEKHDHNSVIWLIVTKIQVLIEMDVDAKLTRHELQ